MLYISKPFCVLVRMLKRTSFELICDFFFWIKGTDEGDNTDADPTEEDD